MNITQLRPAGELAASMGVKCLVYGDPGTGKTPALSTAPRPVLCACEPGLRSMSGSTVPTWEAYTPDKMYEFFDWLFASAEAKAFDTVGIDSTSQFAELVLGAEMPKHKDPRKAYGEMARKVYTRLEGIFYLRQKHVYLIAKKATYEDNGVRRSRPYYPGQDLNIKVPHLYDEILHMERVVGPDGKQYPVFRTVDNGLVMARDRSGRLAELEAPNLTHLFTKAMQ